MPDPGANATIRRLTIGVIGHVDHGKTSLVRALTGMETDRLPEEKRRGISITLGFAHLSLPGIELDLIDMPGHERFVRTMVSGATGVDAVLLVVAANEGVRPQTLEHLDIAGLLGIHLAMVVATKADLATEADAARVLCEAADHAGRARLKIAAALAVSSLTGQGMAKLCEALAALPGASAPAPGGFAYLPIDRVFTMQGHGTVVTGTLRRGALAASDEMEIVPAGITARLRSLQVHGARVASAQPGQRVAANLRDISLGEIRRGAALCARGLLDPALWLSVSLRVVESAPPLATGMRLNLLFGTEEVEVRLRLLAQEEARAGEVVLAQLRCAELVSVPARERFILRTLSPPLTVAGGMVLDPAATRLRRYGAGGLLRLAAMLRADTAQLLRQEMDSAGAAGIRLARLSRLAGVAPARCMEMLQGRARLVGRDRLVVAQEVYAEMVARLAQEVAQADADPGGLTRAALAAALPGVAEAVLDEAAHDLLRRGAIEQVENRLCLRRPDRANARAADDSAIVARIAEALRRGGLTPPDLLRAWPAPATRRLLERLIREGVVIRTRDRAQKRDVLFHRDAVEAARRQLAPLLRDGPGLLVGEIGSALGISRKFCVPLLEHLDAIHFTRRVADRRLLAHPE